jgi:hypothetical protein
VSLGTLGTAFVPVAVLFILAGMMGGRWGGGWGLGVGGSGKEGAAGAGHGPGVGLGPQRRAVVSWGGLLRAVWLPATAEALVLTLLAALWFDSLGHGGWWLPFLLVGALASGADRWARRRLEGTSAGRDLRWLAVGLLKYLAAGMVCAWRLS